MSKTFGSAFALLVHIIAALVGLAVAIAAAGLLLRLAEWAYPW